VASARHAVRPSRGRFYEVWRRIATRRCWNTFPRSANLTYAKARTGCRCLAPGGQVTNQTVGPLVLARSPGAQHACEVDPARARSLCGRLLDWIEIVR
jgi:hypothetical protein